MSAPSPPSDGRASRDWRSDHRPEASTHAKPHVGRPSKAASKGFERRLVSVSTELFRTFGFHAASVEDIVEATGLTRPTLYRHFGSKEGLAVACVRADGIRESAELTAAAGREGSMLAHLWAVADWHAERLRAPDYRQPLALRALHDFPDAAHLVHRAARESLARRLAAIASLLASLAPASTAAAAEQFLLLLLGSGEAALATDRQSAADHFLTATDDLLGRVDVQLAARLARPTRPVRP